MDNENFVQYHLGVKAEKTLIFFMVSFVIFNAMVYATYCGFITTLAVKWIVMVWALSFIVAPKLIWRATNVSVAAKQFWFYTILVPAMALNVISPMLFGEFCLLPEGCEPIGQTAAFALLLVMAVCILYGIFMIHKMNQISNDAGTHKKFTKATLIYFCVFVAIWFFARIRVLTMEWVPLVLIAWSATFIPLPFVAIIWEGKSKEYKNLVAFAFCSLILGNRTILNVIRNEYARYQPYDAMPLLFLCLIITIVVAIEILIVSKILGKAEKYKFK